MSSMDDSIDRSAMDDFIASLSSDNLPKRKDDVTPSSFSIQFSSDAVEDADSEGDGDDAASQASTISFASEPTSATDTVLTAALAADPSRIRLDPWGLHGGSAQARIDDEDACPQVVDKTSDSIFAESMVDPLEGGEVSADDAFNLAKHANFNDDVQNKVITEVGNKKQFMKVAARAVSRPFALNAPSDLKWLSWIPMPRIAVQDMIEGLGEEPFQAALVEKLQDVNNDTSIVDLSDQDDRRTLFKIIASELGKRWHAAATAKKRDAEGGNMTTMDVWPKRRGWNTARNLMLQGKGIFAWQSKLVRLSNRRPPSEKDEDEDELALSLAQLKKLRAGSTRLLDVFTHEALDLKEKERRHGIQLDQKLPLTPFFASVESELADRVLHYDHDTSVIQPDMQVVSDAWELTGREHDGDTLTFTYSRRPSRSRSRSRSRVVAILRFPHFNFIYKANPTTKVKLPLIIF